MQSGTLSQERGEFTVVTRLLWQDGTCPLPLWIPAPTPTVLCPSPFHPKKKSYLHLWFSPSSLRSFWVYVAWEKCGALQAHGLVASFPLTWQGPAAYPATQHCRPSLSPPGIAGGLTIPQGVWPRAGGWFPFELARRGWGWVGQITQKEGLCVSKAQVRPKPAAQTGSKRPPALTPQRKRALSL